ncbi:CoxG family protein [Paenibacillus sp. OV219]|uniref:CoxG family protein n=1 Tax=Paenibacillus sp. OV219 TaxID=1884377 RepID=UPI0008BF5393|nr:SRPBCC domain-containing protein [Paenibacillus sp. OV219]SEN80829.1 hypothetical protein SAMN05518847_104192 [Paenibacillus sp. OV219]
MIFHGSFRVPSDRSHVFAVFMDAEKLAGCVSGVKNIKVLSPTQYEAEMEVKIQFMTLAFKAVGELQESVENESIQVEMSGKPVALAGVFRNRLNVHFDSPVPDETIVTYEMDVQMTGRLASLGEILIRKTVEKSAIEFADNVKKIFN